MYHKILSFVLEHFRRLLMWTYMHVDALEPDPFEGYTRDRWKDEVDDDAEVPDGVTDVNLHKVEFGDLSICCPACGDDAEEVMIGLGVREENDEEMEVNSISTIGVIIYPCSDVFYSTCLTEKVAKILDAGEQGNLRLQMFVDLISCDEHGAEYQE